MRFKLAYKNAFKSMKDYLVYFVTLVFAVTIFYVFNAIYAQETVIAMGESTHDAFRSITRMINVVSVFVSFVLGFLIVYANAYFIKRRHRELGTYLILGMTKGSVSMILFLETLFIGILALGVGLISGVIGSQFMSLFTAKLFEADMTRFQFVIAPQAIGKSILYFSLIFCLVVILNTLAMHRLKLIQLIRKGTKSYGDKLHTIKVYSLVLGLAVISIFIGYHLILRYGILDIGIPFGLSLVFGSLGTFLFYYAIAGLLTHLMKKRPQFYYRNLNSFISQQIMSKMRLNFISISVVCLVLLLTIGIFASGYSLQYSISKELRAHTPFVASIESNGDDDGGAFKAIRSKTDIVSLSFYDGGYRVDDLTKAPSDKVSYPLYFIKSSDFNALMTQMHKPTIDLGANDYSLLSNYNAYEGVLTQVYKDQLTFDDALHLKGDLIEETIVNEGVQVIAIVNDAYVEGMTPFKKVYNFIPLAFKEKEVETWLLSQTHTLNEAGYALNLKRDILASAISSKAIISFLAIYLGIVFMLTSAAILAIQQLSESLDSRPRYEKLYQLGVSYKALSKALFIQILVYFITPMVLAIVHSVVGLMAINDVLSFYGEANIVGMISIVTVFILLIYGLYFWMTYQTSKQTLKGLERL